MVFVIADLASAMLIRAIGNILNVAYSRKLNTLKLGKLVDSPGKSKIFFDHLKEVPSQKCILMEL